MGLYSPLCAAIWEGVPQVLSMVCHNLGGATQDLTALGGVLAAGPCASAEPPRFLIHWLGI